MKARHAGLLLLLSVASVVHASPITFNFTGIVTFVSVDEVYGDIAAFDPLLGSLTFDSLAPDLIPGDPASGSYTSLGAPFGMSMTIGAHFFSTFGSLNIGIVNAGVDLYTVLAQSAGGDLTLELFLQDNSATALNTDSLLVVPAWSNFTITTFRIDALINNGQLQVDGDLTNLSCGAGCEAIPEPGMGWLAGASLVLGAVIQRRRVQRK